MPRPFAIPSTHERGRAFPGRPTAKRIAPAAHDGQDVTSEERDDLTLAVFLIALA
jgi:hypothetical protein